MLYLGLKHSHVLLVVLSVCLFNLRYFMRVLKPQQPLARLWRVLPHIVDTLLLLSGLGLIWITGFIPMVNAQWLGLKLLLLLLYIGFGFYAMRSRPRRAQAIYSYVLAMLAIGLMVYLAWYKPILWV